MSVPLQYNLVHKLDKRREADREISGQIVAKRRVESLPFLVMSGTVERGTSPNATGAPIR